MAWRGISRRHVLAALAGAGLWRMPGRARAESAAILSFGVVPQQAAGQLEATWGPALRYLARRTGLPLRFATAADIPAFEAKLEAGEYDLAYMNPYHYTVYSVFPGYRAFAREWDGRIQGILVVPKDSPIQSIRELEGMTLGFPAPTAFAASLLTHAALAREGIRVDPRFLASHDAVYHAVAAGQVPAGGGISRTFDALPSDVRDRMRILWRTGTYSPHAFAAHPRVPPWVPAVLLEEMAAMSRDPEGKALLAALSCKGFEEAVDADWDDVRALGIGK